MIKGTYTLHNGKSYFQKKNLITLLGDSFFLNRMITNQIKPIEYIVFGNSQIRPTRNDLSLGNEILRKKCSSKIDLENKKIILTCTCNVQEIIDTTEIGVHNGDILISHDVYELPEGFIDETLDTIDVKYTFELEV